MGNRPLTLHSIQLLLAHSFYKMSGQKLQAGSEVHEFWVYGQKPSRCCTTEYLCPNPSDLLTSLKADQNNLHLTSYLSSFLLHLQALEMGIPAHPASVFLQSFPPRLLWRVSLLPYAPSATGQLTELDSSCPYSVLSCFCNESFLLALQTDSVLLF